MNRKNALLTLIITLLIFMPTTLVINNASAQSSGYTVQNVDHTVEVLLSGHVVVRDDIKISGSVASGFQIGIPSKYASSVLKAVAYDNNREYPVTLGTQLGGQSGFYGIQVNFEGQNPTSFTVQFVLSNDLISGSSGYYYFDYPAYPALTTTTGQCIVTISLPAETDLTISKSDGDTNSTTYSKSNMAAYTNSPALASFYIPTGLMQLVDINSYTRTLTVLPSGTVSCKEEYNIKSLDSNSIAALILCLPPDAENVVTRSGSGAVLASDVLGAAGSSLLVNASLPAYLSAGQSTQITVEYTLPNISTGSNDLMLFPTFNYLVDTATFTITTPEGATITTTDPTATVTTNGYEQKVTLTREDVTYVDSAVPDYNYIQFNYNYSPFWASYRPTIIVFGLSAVGCAGVIFWTTKRKPLEIYLKKAAVTTTQTNTKSGKPKTATAKTLKTTPELLRKFVDDYELRTELLKEQEALDLKVQKGRIPRSQYKTQKKAIAARVEGLNRSLNEAEGVFRNSNPEFADLMEQLEQAEKDLNRAEAHVKSLELQRKSGEITIEEYKENIGDAEQEKETAESVVNGILLQLREKIQ